MSTTESTLEGAALERDLESVESELYADLYGAMPPGLAEEFGVSVTRDGNERRFTLGALDHPFYNRVMGAGLGRSADAAWLRAHMDHYREAGVRRYMLQVLPHVETQSLRELFREHGLVRLRGWAKHVGPAGAAPEVRSELRVEEIGTDRAEPWARVCAEGFGLLPRLRPWLAATVGRPRWRHYLALDRGVPAACAALFAHGRFATLGFASTLPEHRRRGAQSALIARRIRDAADSGCRFVVTETDEELPDRPNPSYHNVVRLGLPLRYVRANWGPPKPDGT